MTEFDLNNPFNDASKDGMLPDGCGIFERYYTSGQEVDFCGLSPNPDDYETPQTLYEKILELVKRIIVAVDLNTNGTYKPSDFDIYPLIANATSVKDAVELLSKYIEDLQQKKFDKLNLKLKYENGNVSLVFNGEAYTTINIPEEQFLDSEETKFISAATVDDYMNDSSVIVGKPYLKLSFKTIDASGKPSITYTYIPMNYLFNVYGVEDTNSIDMHMVASGDTNVFSGDLRVNDVSSNALKVDALGAYVEDLNPIIEAEQTRAEAAEKTLTDDLAKEVTRATNMEYNIINMVSNETDRAIEAEKKLQDQITTEVNRASNTEQQLYDRIQAEQTRAVRVEGDLRDDLNLEIQRSTNKDVQLENAIKAEQTRAEAAEKANADAIIAESNRAKNEEARIEQDLNDKIIDNSDAIAAEVTRAKSEETRIETKFDSLVSANTIAIETEVTRATNAEAALNKKIEDETTRAKAAEKVNADAIIAETTRATNRENELDADIKNRIKSITGSNGINATTDINKNVTLSGKIKSGDKILSVDSNGFSSTLGMSISGKTISLTGIGNSEISKITVPNDPFVINGNNVSLNGEFTANKFIANGKTSNDILLGDGSITTISDLLNYISSNIQIIPNEIPRDKLNLANWSINPGYESCFTNFVYDVYKYKTEFNFKGINGWEQLFIEVNVEPNTIYTWQYNVIKLENLTSSAQENRTFRGYVAYSTPNISSPWTTTTDKFLAYQDLIIKWNQPTELSNVATITFNSGSYSKVWLGWNFGLVYDTQLFKVIISNIMFSPGDGAKLFTPLN